LFETYEKEVEIMKKSYSIIFELFIKEIDIASSIQIIDVL